MKDPIHNDHINRIVLKPRFKFEIDADKDEIFNKFRKNLAKKNCKYCSKIVGDHIVIDIPKDEETFWSPQLQIEVESKDHKSVVKGILGPKPKVWTFFMFLHFIVAMIFLVSLVVFYSKWSLGQEHTLSMILTIAMPVIWILLYFGGQLGKYFGYDQMLELHNFLLKMLSKES